MRRLVSLMFFLGFVVISALTIYAVNLKLYYNNSPYGGSDREIADWTFGLLLTSMIGVGFSVIGLYWVRETLLATRGTAEAAREANEITRTSNETSERAWIVSRVKPMSHITLDPDGNWGLPIVIENKNAGKTPALNVSTNVIAASLDEIGGAVSYLRKESGAHLKINGIMLAPNGVVERRWMFHTTMTNEFYHTSSEIPEFIVGCVTYHTIFDEDLHHTIFVYHVSRDTGFEVGFVDPKLYDGMPPEEVYLWPWTGSYAT
ncbi:hypothetical protein [Rhizobium halophilum]|uniref:hypothetical protein n=1 Tax=Rhizobium halophilum TaxID=2846852 RepID=UPI001EFE47C2|nr:hypothetical protein [Rhizobium halophilum]MCF6370964.1 hypothetical protein [Rhizobium halophilum]